jgi:hypothetical protein
MPNLSIGGFSTDCKYTAQPYIYEGDARSGLTARRWDISFLLTSAEWVNLVATYDNWRNLRIQDEDTAKSLIVGTTILFSGTGFGQTWTSVPCWFVDAPSAEQAGTYVIGRVSLVDAAQALEVIIAELERGQDEDLPDLGTLNVGGAVLTLLSPPDTYEEPPQVQPTAGGRDWIQGPRVARRRRNVVGATTAAGWELVKTWFETTVPPTPANGVWYPASAPTAEAKHKIVDGVKIVEYTVNLQQRQIIG